MSLALRISLALLLAATAGNAERLAAPTKTPTQRVRRPIKSAKRAIVLIGLPGSGKSFVSKRLAKRLGTSEPLSSGSVINEAVGKTKSPQEQSRRVLEVAKDFARKKGEVGRRMAQKARADSGDVLIIEGFRTAADLNAFKASFPNTTVIAVDVPTSLRHKRMLERGRAGEDKVSYLRKRDKVERNVGLGDIMKNADLRIRITSDSQRELDAALGDIQRAAAGSPRSSPRR